MRYVERVRGLISPGWRLLPMLNREFLYSMSCRQRVYAMIGGVQISGFPEIKALVTKWRAHCAEDGRSGYMESTANIPVDREITVSRRINIFNGAAVVTTDINGGVIDSLELEPIFLPGKWLSAEIYNGSGFDAFKLNSTIKAALPVAAVTFCAEDGRKFEIGAGDDIWRYYTPQNHGSRPPELTITPQNDGIMITRKIIDLPESVENFPARPWRFSWYFAWNSDAPYQDYSGFDCVAIPDLDIPENARTLNANMARCGCPPCLLAAATRKTVRKIIRSAENNLALTQAQANFCSDAAHLERPRKRLLDHWDLTELFDLHVWGTKQMNSKNLKFAICFAKDSPQNRLLAAQAIQCELTGNMEIDDYE